MTAGPKFAISPQFPKVKRLIGLLAGTGLVLFAGAKVTVAAPETEAAWTKVAFETRDHAPLLERQAKLSPEQAHSAVVVAVMTLQPDVTGLVSAVSASYDTMENPAEVRVTVTERGILDDDLLAIRHVVSLAKNSNGEWRVAGYRRGELRRSHLG